MRADVAETASDEESGQGTNPEADEHQRHQAGGEAGPVGQQG